jgi:hypothetical protein
LLLSGFEGEKAVDVTVVDDLVDAVEEESVVD